MPEPSGRGEKHRAPGGTKVSDPALCVSVKAGVITAPSSLGTAVPPASRAARECYVPFLLLAFCCLS